MSASILTGGVFVQLLRFYRDQFASSFRALSKTRTLTTTGLLLAVQIVLGSYGTIEVTDSLKISLSHLALAPTAIFFGPVVASLQGALSDIVGYLLKPTGPYFPGFTLATLLLGLIYGVSLYKTKHTMPRIVITRIVVMVLVNLLLNTFCLVILYGPSRLATFPVRAVKNILQLPIDCILLHSMCSIVKRLPNPDISR